MSLRGGHWQPSSPLPKKRSKPQPTVQSAQSRLMRRARWWTSEHAYGANVAISAPQTCSIGTASYEWTRTPPVRTAYTPLRGAFARSLHVMVVDAGDCGACLNEVKQLNNPLYNMHRLGIFLTATPRTADVLLVVGPVSENMRGPLVKTYEAMPDPKRVLAVGTCAITGGVFGRSFMSAGGVGSVLPVDLEVPGDPPPPLAILHALLVMAGRKDPMPHERQLSEES